MLCGRCDVGELWREKKEALVYQPTSRENLYHLFVPDCKRDLVWRLRYISTSERTATEVPRAVAVVPEAFERRPLSSVGWRSVNRRADRRACSQRPEDSRTGGLGKFIWLFDSRLSVIVVLGRRQICPFVFGSIRTNGSACTRATDGHVCEVSSSGSGKV